jgi:Putative glycosyl/glycerophosphate transferases involved in teichoic acid biosynthesis TagF/TagB/EpsJ/RodC
MITDYSSVAFDFSIYGKPVIYYQYGNDYNFEEGYFKYKTMGFGEVTDNEDDLINILEDYLNDDCTMKEEYKSRVDNFYKYDDKNNCERVYNAILNLKD